MSLETPSNLKVSFGPSVLGTEQEKCQGDRSHQGCQHTVSKVELHTPEIWQTGRCGHVWRMVHGILWSCLGGTFGFEKPEEGRNDADIDTRTSGRCSSGHRRPTSAWRWHTFIFNATQPKFILKTESDNFSGLTESQSRITLSDFLNHTPKHGASHLSAGNCKALGIH